ncbi:MAG: tetratricopeptide repeat protein [Verrucomicrobiota bacterium]
MPKKTSCKLKNFYLPLLCCLLLGIGSAAAVETKEDVAEKQLALLGRNMESESALKFQTLLEDELLNLGPYRWIERSQLNLIFDERQRNMLFSEQAPEDDSFPEGGLEGIDLLILVEEYIPEKSESQAATDESYLRFRLLEPRYGMKLADFRLVRPEADSVEDTVAFVARKIMNVIDTSEDWKKSGIAVGVVPFVNIDAAARWDYLGEALHTGVERSLCTLENITVLERKHGGPLAREREITSGLPPALAPSLLLVKGEYNVISTSAGKQVQLRLRIHNSEDESDIEIDLPPIELERVSEMVEAVLEKVVEAVEDHLGKPLVKRRHTESEAMLLLQESRLQPLPAIRIALLETALAIAPRNRRCLFAYLESVFSELQKLDWGERQQHPLHDRAFSEFRQLLTHDLKAHELDQSEKDVLISACLVFSPFRPPFWQDDSESPFADMNRYFVEALQLAEPNPVEDDGYIFDVQDLSKSHTAGDVVRDRQMHLKKIMGDLLAEPQRWADSPETMFRLFQWMLDQELFFFLVEYHPLASEDVWRQAYDDSALEKARKEARVFFQNLAASADPEHAVLGHYGLTAISLHSATSSHSERRQKLQEYLEIYIQSGLWQEPRFEVQPWVTSLLKHSHSYYADRKENRIYKAEKAGEVLEEILQDKLFPTHNIHFSLKLAQLMVTNLYESDSTYMGLNWRQWADDITRMLRTYGYNSTSYELSYSAGKADYQKNTGRKPEIPETGVLMWTNMLKRSIPRANYKYEPSVKQNEKLPKATKAYTSLRSAKVVEFNYDGSYASWYEEAPEQLQRDRTRKPPISNPQCLLNDDGTLGIVFQNGVAFLDPATLTETDRFLVRYDADINITGPAVAEDGLVCLGTEDGFLVLPNDGREIRPYRLEEGELPGRFQAGFDILKGNIYVVMRREEPKKRSVHTRFLSGDTLVEIDSQTWEARTLLSKHAELNTENLPFEIDKIHNVIADRTHAKLLMTITTGAGETIGLEYEPVKRQMGYAGIDLHPHSYRVGDSLYTVRKETDSVFTHIPTGIEKTWVQHEPYFQSSWLRPSPIFNIFPIGNGAIQLINPYMVSNQGHQIALYLHPPLDIDKQELADFSKAAVSLTRSDREYDKITVFGDELLFSPDSVSLRFAEIPQVLDMAMLDRGLLILNQKGLYLSRGMTAFDQPVPQFSEDEIARASRLFAFLVQENMEKTEFQNILRRNFGYQALDYFHANYWEIRENLKTLENKLWPEDDAGDASDQFKSEAQYREAQMIYQVFDKIIEKLPKNHYRVSVSFSTNPVSFGSAYELIEKYTEIVLEHYPVPSSFRYRMFEYMARHPGQSIENRTEYWQRAKSDAVALGMRPHRIAYLLYNIGLNLKRQDKLDQAEQAWRRIINEYPHTKWAEQANEKLEKL